MSHETVIDPLIAKAAAIIRFPMQMMQVVRLERASNR